MSEVLIAASLVVAVSSRAEDGLFLVMEAVNVDSNVVRMGAQNGKPKIEGKQKLILFGAEDLSKGKWLISLYDEHPGIARSCIACSQIEVSGDKEKIEKRFFLKEKNIRLEVREDLLPIVLKGDMLIGRMRRLNGFGRVDQWVAFTKVEGSWVSKVPELQLGKYIFEIYEKNGLVEFSAQEVTGLCPYWITRVEVKNGSEMIIRSAR